MKVLNGSNLGEAIFLTPTFYLSSLILTCFVSSFDLPTGATAGLLVD